MPHSLASQRLEGIAAWRAMLMLGGLLVHAAAGNQDHPGLGIVAPVSAMFRMGCFFLISGLLGGAALMRQADGGDWLRRRMIRIGVPTLFGLAVLSPLTRIALGGDGPRYLVYHLWFMIALIAYLAIGYAAHRLGGIGWAPFDRLDARLGHDRRAQPMLLGVTALASFSLMLAGLSVTLHCVPERLTPAFAQVWLGAGYAPLFLLGFVLARAPALRRSFCADWRGPAGILVTIALVHIAPRLLHAPMADGLDQFIHVAGMAAAPPAAAALMLRSALAVRRAPALLARLSAASFTMYLVHYPLMAAIRATLAPLGWGPWAMFAAMLTGGGGLSYLIWAWPVRRSAILSLLLAGRLPPSPIGSDGRIAAGRTGGRPRHRLSNPAMK